MYQASIYISNIFKIFRYIFSIRLITLNFKNVYFKKSIITGAIKYIIIFCYMNEYSVCK
jgi:hypothetical protein